MKKVYFIVLFVCSTVSYALQGGPTQPDYVQFEPSGMKDMVSMQTGDFSYQIPLSDIPSPYGNFPLSLSYHAGISPQQEASWVGLGWILNPGSITRDIRGVPDDQFHGGTLGFIYQYSATQVWSLNLGYSKGCYSVGQTFSSDGSVGFSATLGPKLEGIGGVGYTIGTDAVGVQAFLGYENVGLNSSILFSTKDGSATASIGASIHAGGASVGAQISTGNGVSGRVGFGDSKSSVGLTVSSDGVSASIGTEKGDVSLHASRNGTSVSVGSSTTTISNSVTKGSNSASTTGFAIIVPTYIGVFSFGFNQTTYEYWMRSATSEYMYGYLYQSGLSIDVAKKNDVDGAPDAQMASKTAGGTGVSWNWTMKGRSLESIGKDDMHPAYDLYSVSSEGVSGSFRPFAREKHQLHKRISNKWSHNKESMETYSTIMNDCDGDPCVDEFVYTMDADSNKKLNRITDDKRYPDYEKCLVQKDSCSIYALYETNYRNQGNRLLINSNEDEFEERGGIRFIFAGEGNGYYESDDVGDGINRSLDSVSKKLLRHSVGSTEYALFGSKKVEPIFDSSLTGKLKGFIITTADGTKFRFMQPINSYLKVDYSINQAKGIPLFVDKSTGVNENFWDNFRNSISDMAKWSLSNLIPWKGGEDLYNFLFKAGELAEKCTTNDDSKSDDYYYSYSINMNPHATQWLITDIQGADYVAFEHDTIGYNIKFHYTEPSLYRWRTPYSRPGVASEDLPNFRVPHDGLTPEGCNSKMYQASFGIKEYVYLKSIESSTHRVEFELNQDERVDGKGWDSQGSSIPIMVQASISFDVKKIDETKKYNFSPKWIYFNTPLPESILKKLYNKKISIMGMFVTQTGNFDSLLCVKDSYSRTAGDESRYGLYKMQVTTHTPIIADLNEKIYGNDSLMVFGENGNYIEIPYIDWSDFIFAEGADSAESSSFENQMRYLKKISYYRKGSDSAYKEYNFNYDYSLQPKTLNSYCKGRYPDADSVDQIVRSPDSVGVDICKIDTISKSLYGKLTLRSITETGCQNGKCATLPPFVFSYNSPSATSTRISKKDGWVDFFQGIADIKGNDTIKQYPDDYLNEFKDVDATILASSNTTDEYGFWSNTANIENHKVNQAFADYGAAAWSLNKVVDPTGGNLEIEYERDTYIDGVDHSNEVRTIEFSSFDKCSDFDGVPSEFSDNLCFKIEPLYWKEECLGPRAAHWDLNVPEGFNGNKYAYLDSMGGLKIGDQVFFNMLADVKTKVQCGLFGIALCSRTRSVALMGDAILRTITGNEASNERILVFDKLYSDVESYIIRAGKRINNDQDWDVSDGYGYLWTSMDYPSYKAGDLRVSKLTRHDFNLDAQTTYDYGAGGEIAQLPDSVYTTVLGNRFFGSKLSYTSPDLKTKPVSRIVGFNDEDLMYLPGARITYPKVTVTNSSENGSVSNGTTVFSYITPETGIPEEYIDDSTKKVLKPFFKVNIRNIHAYEYNFSTKFEESDGMIKTHEYEEYNDAHIFKIALLDKDKKEIYEDSVNQKTLSRTVFAFRDELYSLYFYSEKIKDVRFIEVSPMSQSGAFDKPILYDLKKEIKFEEDSVSTKKNVWGNFNEIMLAVVSTDLFNEDTHINFAWFRSQQLGYYPIVYKKIDYVSKTINLNKMTHKLEQLEPTLTYHGGITYRRRVTDDPKYSNLDTIDIDFDSCTTYHDLTAFLGLNYKTVIKRGPKDNAIVIKMDSSIYSTVVPDALGQPDSVKHKIGRQVEKWSSEQKLQCVDDDGDPDEKGNEDICMKQYMKMYLIPGDKIVRKEFTYIRYPAFQIGSVSYVGHDNQTNGSEPSKFGKTELHNHAYDPLTGSPTASLATLSIENGMVSRKLTKKTPYYSIKNNALSDSMFIRNMLTQNYMDEVFTDTLKNESDSAWDDVMANQNNLRSFSISPYRFAFNSSNNVRNPIVAWGLFKSLLEPKDIKTNAMIYANGDSTPSLTQYSGSHIVSIDSHFKVTETKDVFNRSLSTLFSNDAMFQLSLFYPATRNEVGAILPYRDSVYSSENCSSLHKTVMDGVILMGDEQITISCDISTNLGNIAKEYRIWTPTEGWITRREIENMKPTVSLDVPVGAKINYFRVYPERAESKSFIYDRYDNLIQIVAEDNTSTYYEYDPLGHLVQSRNDDGVSFKSLHREYMNDTAAQRIKGGVR